MVLTTNRPIWSAYRFLRIELMLLLACVSCDAGVEQVEISSALSGVPALSPASVDSAGTATPAASEPVAPIVPRDRAPAQIRGLYLNAFAAGSSARLARLLEIAADTEINTFVIDVKDERGIRHRSEIPLAMELAQPGEVAIRNLSGLLETLDDRGIYRIARIVVFNDPLLSAARPGWSIRRPDGGVWLDRSGNSWVSPWEREVWEYNLAIAEEAARAGFDEIQFDYVRFPEQFRSLPAQVHPRASGDRTDAIVEFLTTAKERLHPLGVAVSADVFGLSPSTFDDVGIGQQWERLATVADHILPMMYPSHYFATHLPNVPRPNAMPYETVFKSAGMARLRNDRLRDAGVEPARVIVWLQAFQAPWLRDGVVYGPEEIRKQTQAVYDAGFDDWILWHPGSQFQPFVEGLAHQIVSRAATAYDPPEDVLATVNRFETAGVRAAREGAITRLNGAGAGQELVANP